MKNIALIALTVAAAACSTKTSTGFTDDLPAGRMAGNMPVIAGFDQQVTDDYVVHRDDYLDIELHTDGEQGWAMVSGWVRLDEPLADGQVYEFTGRRAEAWLGCSSSTTGYEQYDEAPDRVTVVISELPEVDVNPIDETPDDFGVQPPINDDGASPGDDVLAPTIDADMVRDGADTTPATRYKVTVHADFGSDGVLSAATIVQ